MWYRILPTILSLSLTGSIVILFVFLARLALKNVPRIFSYALWSVVLFRLLCPVVPTSQLSLLNLLPDNWETTQIVSDINHFVWSEPEHIQSNPEYIVDPDVMSQPIVSLPNADPGIDTGDAFNDSPTDTVPSNGVLNNETHVFYEIIPSRRVKILHIGTLLWLGGVLVLFFYSLRSLQRLRRQLNTAVPLRDNIYLADHIATPFVLGILRPRIYLPSSLPEESQSYILRHEQHHIRRKDHVWKLLAFVALCIHWFNPLVWLAFVLAGKDMEMSCDEAVLRRMGDGIRADYSASLLTLSTGQRIFAGTPLAFGEGDTKDRIHHILSWKKPRIWIIIATLIVCLLFAASLLTDPRKQPEFAGARYTVKEILYDAPQYSFTYTVDTAPEFTITSDYVLLGRYPIENDGHRDWQQINGLYQVDYSRQELYALFDPLYCTAHEKLDQIDVIYRAEPFNVSASVFFLVMQTKDGDILLAQGYGREGEDNQHVRWLFLLEKQGGNYHLNHMRQILKDTYGEETEYFSLCQCDTQPDTILLGFQVGISNAKGPSAVGYAAFRYDKTADDYLLAHSEILSHQVTGLYPVKLYTLDNAAVNLQLVLSIRKDLSAVKISSPLKDRTDFMITQDVIGGTGVPSMLVFECPDELTLKTLNIQYLYDDSLLQTSNSLLMKLGHYYMVDTGSDSSNPGSSSDYGDPSDFSSSSDSGSSSDPSTLRTSACLTLEEGNVFTFTYDLLSSYLNRGHYTIHDDLLMAVTDDGRFQYCFRILDENTLCFLQEQSSEVSPIDEGLGQTVTDGSLFRCVWFSDSFQLPSD